MMVYKGELRMKLVSVLLVIIGLISCNSTSTEKEDLSDCTNGGFECAEGFECTSQLTARGESFGCTPVSTQAPPPVNVAAAPIGGEMAMEVAGTDLEPESESGGTEWMSDFTPQEMTPAGMETQEEEIDRQAAQGCLEIFECFNEEECGQTMMLEEEQECVNACVLAAPRKSQVAFSNFSNCLRLNCVTAGGEFMGDQCIIANCFYQADACNLLVPATE